MTPIDKEYDIVTETLQKQYNILLRMTEANIKLDLFNVMDQIRLEQMDELQKAIKVWEHYKKGRKK